MHDAQARAVSELALAIHMILEMISYVPCILSTLGEFDLTALLNQIVP